MPLGDQTSEWIPYQDKYMHFLMYFIQAYLIYGVLSQKYQNTKSVLILSIVLASGFGLMLEFIQEALNTGRHFDYFDIIANIIGSLVGSLLNNFLRTK